MWTLTAKEAPVFIEGMEQACYSVQGKLLEEIRCGDADENSFFDLDQLDAFYQQLCNLYNAMDTPPHQRLTVNIMDLHDQINDLLDS